TDYSIRQTAVNRLVELFAKLAVKDRGKLFETFHPKLARNLELGWQLRGRLPYQLGSARRAYHMPPDDRTAFASRLAWFRAVHSALVSYDQDIHWVAEWAVHISSYSSADAIGILLAAALDDGDAEVFETLNASASNQDEMGSVGRHVTRGLLCSAKPEAWEFAEKLLLAAQRQEGLRQVILETIDEAHPEAFKRMMRLILSENLLRFSSV